MNEITSISPQIKDKKRCNIYIDGRFYCGMLLETAVKNRLKVGRVVTEQELSKMQLESEKSVALDKALTHISAARKTEKQVRDFLKSKGYLSDVVEYVVEKMKDYGFLNDGEYAETYVEFTSQKKGARLIKMELKSKGISDLEIESALNNINEDAQIQTAKGILEKYMKNKDCSRETLQKAFRYLMGKGFETDVIKTALFAYGDCEDD
jgi:regulatory protein